MKYPQSYICWDLETTGFDTKTCKITEIGVIKVVDGETVEKKSWLLNHNIEIPEHITEITTIDKALLDKEGEDPEKVMEEFLEGFVKDSEHNLTHNGYRFDIPFLLGQMTEEQVIKYKDILVNGCIDSAVLYKAKCLNQVHQDGIHFNEFAAKIMSIFAKGIKYNVAHCCNVLGIDSSTTQFHRALGDVYLTNEIYKKLIWLKNE